MIGIAQEEASRLNHDFVGPELILLGLIREDEATAAKVLESLGISLEKVRQEVRKSSKPGSRPRRVTLRSPHPQDRRSS